MTPAELEAAGFKRFGPTQTWNYDALFQKRIRDSAGTKYFIDVTMFENDDEVSWQVELNFSIGPPRYPRSNMRLQVYPAANWTVAQVEAWAGEMWREIAPNYYELDQSDGQAAAAAVFQGEPTP